MKKQVKKAATAKKVVKAKAKPVVKAVVPNTRRVVKPAKKVVKARAR